MKSAVRDRVGDDCDLQAMEAIPGWAAITGALGGGPKAASAAAACCIDGQFDILQAVRSGSGHAEVFSWSPRTVLDPTFGFVFARARSRDSGGTRLSTLNSADYEQVFVGLASRLQSLRTGGPVIACAHEEVEDVRTARGGRLPLAYEAFLKVMGRRGGVLWLAEEWFYPDILRTDRSDIEWLANDLGVSMPAGRVLPLMTHAGYEFKWLGESTEHPEDPPVWQLLEGFDPPLKSLSSSYTEYVADQVRIWEDYVETHPDFYFPRP